MERTLRLLNIFEAPLGIINLIEASAGTGKTYAITGIFSLTIRIPSQADRIPLRRSSMMTKKVYSS